jgi:acyl-CoA synthetase (AMP-forming)/AMP-acid ligase II
LIDFCKTRLAGYKCPKKILFRSALPRNSMGKLQKHLLQKEYI